MAPDIRAPAMLRPRFSIREHDDDLRGLGLLDMKLRQLLDSGFQVGRADDRVPPVDRLGQVAGQLHRDGTGNPGAFEVANGGAPEVVNEATANTGRDARLLPCAPEIEDRLSGSVEHVADDPLGRLLDRHRPFALPLQ